MSDASTITSPTPDPDAALLARARSGDFAAFEELVTQYERAIFSVTLRILNNRADAEEIVQETFLSVVQHLDRFEGRSSFRTWLFRIATNHALKRLRKRRGLRTTSLDGAGTGEGAGDDAPLPHPQTIAPWKTDPLALASAGETREILDRAIGALPEKYRLVFLLRDVQGLSTEETAEALGLTLSNTKVRLLRARLMLREDLTRQFGDPERRLAPHEH